MVFTYPITGSRANTYHFSLLTRCGVKRASIVDNIIIFMYYIMSKHKKYRSTETDSALYVS